MEEYKIRNAQLKDIPFLAEVIVAAEKSGTDKLSYSTLFDLPESKVIDYICAILEEEIDGCEFSLSSFLVTECIGQPVAALGGWIEGWGDNPSSKLIKSNLISFTFPKENIQSLISHTQIINDIFFEREKDALQLEYTFVKPEHRGKHLFELMVDKMVENNLTIFPDLKKIQFQCYKNNKVIPHIFEKLGYHVVKELISKNKEVLKYLPDNVKLIMEKII